MESLQRDGGDQVFRAWKLAVLGELSFYASR